MADDLKTELADDPLGRVYSTMSDQEVADDLNTSYRSRNRTSMTGGGLMPSPPAPSTTPVRNATVVSAVVKKLAPFRRK